MCFLRGVDRREHTTPDWPGEAENAGKRRRRRPAGRRQRRLVALLDRDLHERRCPAAAKPAAAVARVVIGGEVEHVLARLAERRVRSRAPAESLAGLELFDLRARFVEFDVT